MSRIAARHVCLGFVADVPTRRSGLVVVSRARQGARYLHTIISVDIGSHLRS
jgi:hypothetical protein